MVTGRFSCGIIALLDTGKRPFPAPSFSLIADIKQEYPSCKKGLNTLNSQRILKIISRC